MQTVPNQQIVSVNKEKCDKENIYAKINLDAIAQAVKDLSKAEFQVWLYFAKNQQGYTFAVSPAAALKEWGISKDTFHKAVQTLKKKRYLINDTDKGSNYWVFYELPIEEEMYITKA